MGGSFQGLFDVDQRAQQAAVARRLRIEFGHAGAQEAGVGSRPEERGAQSEGREAVSPRQRKNEARRIPTDAAHPRKERDPDEQALSV